VGEKPIKIHPMVARLIDPAVLEKLKLAANQPAPKAATTQTVAMDKTVGNA
jgi:hypothetical protein